MIPSKIGYIGLGHIGGSIAKTVHRIFPDAAQIACDSSQNTLDAALRENIITAGCQTLTSLFSDCDIIFLCTPIETITTYMDQLSPFLHPNLIITDVGSVKKEIHDSFALSPELNQHFIGGHPMCGTERSGYEHSKDYMLENAYYMITPSNAISKDKIIRFKNFVDSIGALPMILDYKKHDHVVGSVSHLPHLISATLVNLVHDLDDSSKTMQTVAAGGFKDITRISSSSPTMWESICLANQTELLNLIDSYIHSMQHTRNSIANSNGMQLRQFFSDAKDYRDSIPISAKGSVTPIYQLFCDLLDETGGIATIATILATNHISIKNIGIVHNREFEQGVLQIIFYQEDDYNQAKSLLERHHYTIYER